MKKLLMEQKQKLLEKEASKRELEKQQSKQQFSAKVPFIGSDATINNQLYNTISEFGKNPPPFKLPISEKEVPRRSLFNNMSPGKSRLPQIVSFGGSEEDGEDDVSQFTVGKSPRPNPNNPLLPIQLNRKISVLMQDSETVTKKIQLPPQATIAFFDEKD